MQTISTIGLDIAKSVFQVRGVDAVAPQFARAPLETVAPNCHNSKL
jgi:hypothetical protein